MASCSFANNKISARSSGSTRRNNNTRRSSPKPSPSLLASAVVLLLVLNSNVSPVWGISRCNQYQLASASIMALSRSNSNSYPRGFLSRRGLPATTTSGRIASPVSITRRRRGSATTNNNHYNYDDESNEDDPYLEETRPVARSKRKKEKASSEKDSKSDKKNDSGGDPFATPMSSAEIYSQLGPVGKCVAGTTEIAVSTCMEYITGFMGGYVLGSITDFPRFAFKQVDPSQKNNPFFKELGQRYGRMHQKSFRWAKSWGGISAAFGGFRIATRVIRGGKEDEWNTVFSSAAAGAFFARNGTNYYSVVAYMPTSVLFMCLCE